MAVLALYLAAILLVQALVAAKANLEATDVTQLFIFSFFLDVGLSFSY